MIFFSSVLSERRLISPSRETEVSKLCLREGQNMPDSLLFVFIGYFVGARR
jgi:hypothetical protein